MIDVDHMVELYFMLISFFFSSRRRHTRLTCDWSSDVCSSDLSGWISTPGVLRGTTNMPFVHMTNSRSATRPALVNHFSPLITHSSPSRTAWVLNKIGRASCRERV